MTSPEEPFEDQELDDVLGRSDQELDEAIASRVDPSEFIDRAMRHPDPASLRDREESRQGDCARREGDTSSRPAVPPRSEVASRPQTNRDERCDRCNAAAKLMIVLAGGGELFFCGHHANRYTELILATGTRVAVSEGFTWRGATG